MTRNTLLEKNRRTRFIKTLAYLKKAHRRCPPFDLRKISPMPLNYAGKVHANDDCR